MLWMSRPLMWMLCRSPAFCASITTPDRVPAVLGAWVLCGAVPCQYCRWCGLPASAAPAALMTGLAPMPYRPMVFGAVLEPEPCGDSVPVHESPALNRTWVPAAKVMLLTLPRLCH